MNDVLKIAIGMIAFGATCINIKEIQKETKINFA